jgi:hypothetical protein
MPDTLSVAGDVAGAGTALAGLILVYLGAMAASYSAYDAASQSDVRIFYRRRAWWAFSGIVISLTAAALGLIAKSTESLCVAVGAAALLFAAFLWAIITALFTVWSIR